MSIENAKTLFNKLREDKNLLEQLKADPDTVLKAYGCAEEELKELEMTAREKEIAAKGKELDMDELAAISGGSGERMDKCTDAWLIEACAATVESGSWCGSNDKCVIWEVKYHETEKALERIEQQINYENTIYGF